MLNVGILGLGGISQAHVSGWLNTKDARVVAVCDIRPQQLTRPVEQTGAKAYTDFETMMSREKLDILDICLPTYLHSEYAVKAMDKGCHVLCEKPAGLDFDDLEREYEAARRNGVHFMIAQVLRFWPEYLALKEMVDKGTLGRVLSGHMSRLSGIPVWSWDNWMKDKDRSGLVPFDLHIHDIDFMVSVFGAPKTVMSRRAGSESQDAVHALYEYDGFFITCDSAWYNCDYPFAASFRFQFEKGVVEYTGGVLHVYEEGGTSRVITPGIEDGEAHENGLGLPSSSGYENEIKYFVHCVLENQPTSRVPEEELKTVLSILRRL